jgi:hypothetical protein
MPEVITYLPQRDYEDLYKTVKRKQIYSETFTGDSVETKIWLQDGKLMSQMKGELRIKQIKPLSKMETEGLSAESGFAKSVEYLVKEKGFPFEGASEFLLHIYGSQKIPKFVELPKEMLDAVRVSRIS